MANRHHSRCLLLISAYALGIVLSHRPLLQLLQVAQLQIRAIMHVVAARHRGRAVVVQTVLLRLVAIPILRLQTTRLRLQTTRLRHHQQYKYLLDLIASHTFHTPPLATEQLLAQAAVAAMAAVLPLLYANLIIHLGVEDRLLGIVQSRWVSLTCRRYRTFPSTRVLAFGSILLSNME